jgi:hypothetical protein
MRYFSKLSLLSLWITFILAYRTQSFKSAIKQFKTHANVRLYSKKDGTDDENNNPDRPPIVSFTDFDNFAREDFRIQELIRKDRKQKEMDELNKAKYDEEKKKAEANMKTVNEQKKMNPVFLDDNARPTGYNTFDEKDLVDPNWKPIYNEDDSALVKFLKDVYIGSPYDSKNKKEARIVVINVTIISVVFGAIFTILYYAFPGKFIGFRADMDLNSKYETQYVIPEKLLEDGFSNSDSVYFDDAKDLPLQEKTRFEVQSNQKPLFQLPERTEDL